MVIHDCDLSTALKAKRTFDVTGHYGREDVLAADSCLERR